MSDQLKGGCLCGSVRYSCNADPLATAICHCPYCQKQTSSAFSVVVAVPKDSLQIEGGALKTYEHPGDSGEPVQRHFCGNCGSPIMSFCAVWPAMEFIKAGTLDDTSWLNPTMEIWCETAQPWVKIDPSRQQVDRNPQLAA